jgi:hypothetical protein
MLSNTKELYASAETWANTTIKQEEELTVLLSPEIDLVNLG